MDVSVIICAYTLERWDLLAQAVSAVHAQSLPAREVILVVALLEGVSAEELKRQELDVRDPGYELLVTVRARK